VLSGRVCSRRLCRRTTLFADGVDVGRVDENILIFNRANTSGMTRPPFQLTIPYPLLNHLPLEGTAHAGR
jgi:hypothetical protein